MIEDVSPEGDLYKHISLRNKIDQGIAFTLAHEIGHSLGLYHSGSPKSLMFNKRTRQARWDENKPDLVFQKDQRDIIELYGERDENEGKLSSECQEVLGIFNKNQDMPDSFLAQVGFSAKRSATLRGENQK